MSTPSSIKPCERKDESEILAIINESARAYRDVIPSDRYHEPYMTVDELRKEMREMTFFGYQENNRLLGIVGYQPVKDVTLLRHLYVRPEYHRHGIGRKLTEHVIGVAKTARILVGTWEAATWAVEFYQRCGFKLLPNKNKILREYWKIPERQIELSGVLSFEKLPRA
jgi:GNAT superfamily N-acetyltransferase